MYRVTLRVRISTFFSEHIEPANITSNECKFNTIKKYEDGTRDMMFLSHDKNIIERIKEMYRGYDYNALPMSAEEKAIKALEDENKSLGQMITDLELALLEMQMSMITMQKVVSDTDVELGNQITDLDLAIIEHKVIEHAQ